jgi:hypothetical protein
MTFVLKKRTFCFLCVIYLAHLLNGVAQEPEYEIADQLITEREEKEKIEKVTQEAQKKRFIEGLAKINYPDVLKDPDNIVLNFKYAQQQIRDNNVLGAAATLERILIIDPSIHKVRLLYAVVLFRLDNLIEAKRELTALIGRIFLRYLKTKPRNIFQKLRNVKKGQTMRLDKALGMALIQIVMRLHLQRNDIFQIRFYPLVAQVVAVMIRILQMRPRLMLCMIWVIKPVMMFLDRLLTTFKSKRLLILWIFNR